MSDGPRSSRPEYGIDQQPGPALDPTLVELGRQALAELAKDGIPPTRDALRVRMAVGNGKASAVWTHLRQAGEPHLVTAQTGSPLFDVVDQLYR